MSILWSVIGLVVLVLGASGFLVYAYRGKAGTVRSVLLSPHVTAHTTTVIPPTPTATKGMSVLSQKVAIPSYFDPGVPDWTKMENDVAVSNLAIINPNSGPGASQDPNYADQVTQAEKSGLTIVGYISTSYAGTHDHARTLTAAERDVDSYYSWYPNIKGIFVDEVSTDCASAYSSYYKPLYDYIKQKGSSAIVVLDPGTNTDECYMSAGDIIVNYDDTYTNYLNWAPVPWVSNYAANRFWQIVYGTSAANLSQAITLSKQRNAGWIYVTDRGGDNPFGTLPSYWSNELLLANHL